MGRGCDAVVCFVAVGAVGVGGVVLGGEKRVWSPSFEVDCDGGSGGGWGVKNYVERCRLGTRLNRDKGSRASTENWSPQLLRGGLSRSTSILAQ